MEQVFVTSAETAMLLVASAYALAAAAASAEAMMARMTRRFKKESRFELMVKPQVADRRGCRSNGSRRPPMVIAQVRDRLPHSTSGMGEATNGLEVYRNKTPNG